MLYCNLLLYPFIINNILISPPEDSESYRRIDMKIKDLIIGIFAFPVLLPIIIIASIQDKKAIAKERENDKANSENTLTKSKPGKARTS